jgi:hypothetical protein
MIPKSAQLLRAAFGMFFITLLAPCGAQPEEKSPADGKSGHLFILSGQSNMTGGLVTGFAEAVTKALGKDQVSIVHCMRGGRGIRFWVKDYDLPESHELHGKLKNGNGEEYPRLLQAIKDAGDARAFKTVTLIWMQGESDAGRDLAVAYGKSFETLRNQLKSDLGLEKMYFVIGRISDFGLHGESKEGWKRMREQQVRIAESDKMGAWIDTDDLNGGDEKNPHGELHYPSEQCPKLGERFGKRALEQLGVK